MADYDLGTAHGKIVVEYKDTGAGKAAQDLEGLKGKAQALLQQFKATASNFSKDARSMAAEGQSLFGRLTSAARSWSQSSQQMVDDVTRFSRAFGVASGALAVAIPLITRVGLASVGLRGGMHIASSLGLALGGVPKGAEGFPSVIKKVIQLSAAISLFGASTGILARLAGQFRGFGTIGKLIGGLGSGVNKLAGPLHAVAGIAGSVAFQILQLRFVKTIIKPVLMLTGALGGLGGALHLVGGLISSIQDLSGILGLLPAGVGVAALAFGALKIGLSGFGAAMKAVGKGNMAAFKKDIAGLAPSAQEAARAIKGIYDTGFKALKLDVQQKLFAGMGGTIKDLGQTYFPILQKALGDTAIQFNAAINGVADFFRNFQGDTQVSTDVAQGFDFLNQTIHNLLSTLPDLVPAFYVIGRVGAEVLAEVTGGAGNAAAKFREFIFEARASGKLKAWMEGGVQAVRDLFAVLVNLGRISKTVWKGLTGGGAAQPFLSTLRDLTARFNEFLQSAQGQDILATLGTMLQHLWENAVKLGDAFVRYVLPAIKAFLPVAQALSSGVIDGIVAGMRILSPLFVALGAALSHVSPLTAIILKGMVEFAVVLAGAALAAKLIGVQIFLLKSGLATVKTVMGVASFAGRVLTGSLSATELAAFRLAGTLGKQLLKSLFSVGTAMKLLKWGLIAAGIDAAIGALQGYTDEQNKAFAAGGFQDDIKTFWDEFKKEPFQAIGKEFRASLTPPPSAGADFKRIGDSFQNDLIKPIGNVGKTIGQSFMTDFVGFFAGLPGKISSWLSGVGASFQTSLVAPIGSAVDSIGTFFTGLPGKIGGWLSGVGASFMTNLGTPILDAVGRIKDSFLTDFVGFFTGLPGRISGLLSGLGSSASSSFDGIIATVSAFPGKVGTYLAGLGTSLATYARNAWDSFKTATVTKFDELGGTVGSLPFRLGKALGSLIGMALKAGIDTWNAFYTATVSGITTAVTYVAGLPARIGAFFTTLATNVGTWAATTWNSFYTATVTWIGNAVTYVTGLPARIGAAFTSLAASVLVWAITTWVGWYNSSSTWLNTFLAYIAALPGRIGAYLAGLAASVVVWAITTWNGFYNAAATWINSAIAYAASLPGRIGAAIAGLVSTVVSAASNAWSQFHARAVALGQQVISYASALPGRIGAAISSLAGQLLSRAQAAWNSFKQAAVSGAEAVIGFARGIPGRIASALGNLGGLLVGAGRAIIDGLLSGLRSAVGAVYDFVSGIAAGIAARKGPIPYDKRLLIPAGNAIIQGLRTGLAQELPGLYRMVGGIGNQVQSAMNVSAGVNLSGTATVGASAVGGGLPRWTGPVAGSDGASAGATTNNFHVTIPAKDIAEMKTVSDFFGAVTQKARAGKASS